MLRKAVRQAAKTSFADASADLLALANLSISPSLYKLPFDVIRDVAPVTTVTFSPYLLTAHPSVPAKSLAELIALAKKNPGKLNVPVGLGSAIHLATLALQQRVGAKWTYVPTRGGQSSVVAVMTGDNLKIPELLAEVPEIKVPRTSTAVYVFALP